MIKMLVIDLDDTLLHTNKTISEFTEATLKKAHTSGLKIVFATGRPIRTVRNFLEQVNCDAVICHNGAVTLIDNEVIGQHYTVPNKEAVRILNNMKQRYPDKKLSVEINDKIYANFDVMMFWGKGENDKAILKNTFIWTDFTDLPGYDADKVIIELSSEEEYKAIMALLPNDLYGLRSDGGKLCMIMNKAATKLNAVKNLAEEWNIPITDIAAFGDDYNDTLLLEQCGIGIAMKNAIPDVIKIADAIADTNNNDGVAKYISEFIL